MNVMIIDTEAVTGRVGGEYYTNAVFDVGFIIYNLEENKVLYEYNALVDEIFSNKELLYTSYFGFLYIKELVNPRAHLSKPIKEVCKDFWSAVKEFNVEEIFAYNVKFDKDALFDTCVRLGCSPSERISLDLRTRCSDLYNMACNAIGKDEKYITFCVENDFLSKTGNVLSSAEAIYAYIKNKPSFVEEHTALSDSKIELDILLWCLEKEKNKNISLPREINTQAWRLVQV